MKKKHDRTMIFDRLRRRFVVLTPEEWVRQNVVEYLIVDKKFPAGLMGNEVSLEFNGLKKRCDTVVYDKKGMPLLIAEFKAPDVPISQQTFDQIMRYNLILKVTFLLISNGMNHFFCHVDYERGQINYLPEVPKFSDLEMILGQENETHC
ncbi:MAG: type I restriction enzyme HsdR N-terminal domain-containing protein [Microbacter sp.]